MKPDKKAPGKELYGQRVDFLASEGKKLRPYWVNTSDNQMVDILLSKG